MATVLTLGSIHLHATTPPATAYNGSGTPWTSASTTPFELAMNDKTGPFWTPKPADAQAIYGGGPPFRSGSDLFYLNYDNVVETIPIHIRATSHDNAVAALRILRQELKKSQWSTPPVLAFQPNTATSAVSFDVYNGDVVETASFVNEEAGRGVLRAVITLTRSFAGGRLSTGETLINAQTIKNAGSGSPNNVIAYSAGSGDMIYEGQPLNISWVWADQTVSYATASLASVYSRVYSTTGAATMTTTNTTTGTSVTLATFDVSAAASNWRLKPRMLADLGGNGTAGANTNAEAQIRVFNSQQTIYQSAWIAVDRPLVDFGTFSLDFARPTSGLPTYQLSMSLSVRSISGSSVSIPYASTQYLLYYDFLTVVPGLTVLWGASSDQTTVNTFPEVSGRACLPTRGRAIYTSSSLPGILPSAGTFPRYYQGSSLWMAWQYQNASLALRWTQTQTATVTATNAPLYKSLRGGG